MKGVEKVKYISGDEGGVDGQDSTVRDSVVLFVFCLTSLMGHSLYSMLRWPLFVCPFVIKTSQSINIVFRHIYTEQS